MPVVRRHRGQVLLRSLREGSQELAVTCQAEGALLGFWRRTVLRRPPLRLFLGCFFPTDLIGCFALSRGGWAPLGEFALLCTTVLSSLAYPFDCWTFDSCMITSSLGSQEKNANTQNTELEQSLHSLGSDILSHSPCCWSTQSALEWKALCPRFCLFFPLSFGWCILEVALYEIGFKRIFVNLG